MKKRVLGLCLAAVLMLGMTVTALASPSTEAEFVTGVESAVDADGKPLSSDGMKLIVEVLQGTEATKYAAQVDYIKNLNNLKKELGSEYEDGMGIVAIDDVYFQGSQDLIDKVKFPITITFITPSVKAGDHIPVLHYSDKKSAWELLQTTSADGRVTAKFEALSPVVFVKKSASSSPATGESPALMFTAAAALTVAAAGAVLAGKKRR